MNDTIASLNGRLQVAFHRERDRYFHIVRSLDDSAAEFQSVEGTDEDRWPPSPPFQQLSIEQLPDGRRVALLVGMAGRSHWSASVEPTEDALVFDVACRVRDPEPGRLASTYRGVVSTGLALTAGHGSSVERSSERCEISPAVESATSGGATSAGTTFRWKYTISSG